MRLNCDNRTDRLDHDERRGRIATIAQGDKPVA